MLLEKDDQVAYLLMFGPGFLDLAQLAPADAFDLAEFIRGFGDRVYGFFAEIFNDSLGQDRTDALDEARGEESFHSLDG